MSRKAIALGCVAVFFVVAVLSAGAFYFFVWKPGSAFVKTGWETVAAGKEYAAGFARLGEIAELDQGIADDSPYQPPADRELAPQQLERFLAVQERVRGELGPRYGELVERYESMGEPAAEVGPKEIAAALQDFGALAVEAKRVQVEEVNAQGFSRDEYAWVKQQVFLALGLGQAAALDVGEMMAAVQEGDLQGLADRASGGERPAVPPATVALVEPHRDELTRWMPLALFGL